MRPWEAPFATARLPGTGGRIRESLEDFAVEEIPLYEPVGAGEHLYLRIEKKGLATLEAVARIARALGVPRQAVGYAGLKDAAATAIQTLSIQGASEAAAEGLDIPGVRVLAVTRHRNKLRKGHLRGNRFCIAIRGVPAGSEARARAVVDALARRGVPNLFGRQRFGASGNSHLLGRAVLGQDGAAFFEALLLCLPQEAGAASLERVRAGDPAGARDLLPQGFTLERRALDFLSRNGGDHARTLRRFDRALKDLYVSALQAEAFNAVLRERFERYDLLLPGELAWLHRNGAVFLVEDPAMEQERAERLEISPSGPLFGQKTARPAAAAAALEDAVLARCGLSGEEIGKAALPPGARRPLRVPLLECALAASGDALSLSFSLPPGAYATSVLREVMKESEGED
ncbi:MAG: tRNA pseudouridine(13) synthase TruD [Planctomycetes bacterium]|nr:tRNA pseudouridine(13) synthase TruD [Planctomycetota bacterium]